MQNKKAGWFLEPALLYKLQVLLEMSCESHPIIQMGSLKFHKCGAVKTNHKFTP